MSAKPDGVRRSAIFSQTRLHRNATGVATSMNTHKPRPVYDIDAPDQQRLKIARIKIEAILAEHDIAGVVTLHTPGVSEFFYNVKPSYSLMHVDEEAQALHVRSDLQKDHGGDRAEQARCAAATANMARALGENLLRAALMFGEIDHQISKAFGATHTPREYLPEPTPPQ